MRGLQVAFRLLPSSLSALIVGVEDLDLARETLRKRGVPHESIGVTGASHVSAESVEIHRSRRRESDITSNQYITRAGPTYALLAHLDRP